MNAPKFGMSRFARAAGLLASVLISVAIFGSIAVGLTWDAGVKTLA